MQVKGKMELRGDDLGRRGHRGRRPRRRAHLGIVRSRRRRNGVECRSRLQPPATWTSLRVADYEDVSALKKALAGIDDLVFISNGGDARLVMRCPANVMGRCSSHR